MTIVDRTCPPGHVMTVFGPVPTQDLGMTLTHEHLICDWSSRTVPPAGAADQDLFHRPMGPDLAWLLDESPFCCRDNVVVDDPQIVAEELGRFTAVGGRTVIDCTNADIGRDPGALQEISRRSGVNVVMGAGWYIEAFHDPAKSGATVDDLAAELVAEFVLGVGTTGVKPGIIGEIGVSPRFTSAERTRLRAAARAQRALGVPMFLHLPGWQRRAHEVLDIVLDDEGVSPGAVVLCHMDPSGGDPDYQRSVAERGPWLEFDMIGMTSFFADEGQSPSPDDTAAAVAGLVADGFDERLLLSHDLSTKRMWTRFGGNGFGYVPHVFLQRLARYGVDPAVATRLVVDNPARVFLSAEARATTPATNLGTGRP